MKRISKVEQLMRIAEVAALRSHDEETQVGCVLVDSKSHMALASACNGFARGVCDHRLPTKRPDKYRYIIHSEINMLASCAKQGISTDGKYLVCTMSPCVTCMRAIYQAGIEKVVVKEKYKDFKSLKEMKDITIMESTTQEGYLELTYKPRLPRIVFIGSNPSTSSPDDSAFHPDTSSGKRIRSWVEGLDIDVSFLNVSNKKTTLNKKPSKQDLKEGFDRLSFELRDLDPDLLVTVGDTAKEVLSMYQCKRHHMPHPSGLSRLWNDKQESSRLIDELRRIISEV